MRRTREILDPYLISGYPDDVIVSGIMTRLAKFRKSCCCSQEEYSKLTGLSMATIKRIDSGKLENITLETLVKLLRTVGALGNLANLVPDVPESPFVNDTTKYFKNGYKKEFK